jgi:hypothetical protein
MRATATAVPILVEGDASLVEMVMVMVMVMVITAWCASASVIEGVESQVGSEDGLDAAGTGVPRVIPHFSSAFV